MSFPKYPKYKDSGVKFLGEVPEHWTVHKFGFAGKLQGGFAFSASDFAPEGTVVVRMNNLKRGVLDLSEAVRISETCCNSKVALNTGDMLWGMSGSTGETGSLGNYARVRENDLPCQLNQRVGRFLVNNLITLDFLESVIQTPYFYEQVMLAVTGTAQFNISSEQVHACVVAIPCSTKIASTLYCS
jgi:type I restriction enzyme, S subunit